MFLQLLCRSKQYFCPLYHDTSEIEQTIIDENMAFSIGVCYARGLVLFVAIFLGETGGVMHDVVIHETLP